MKKFLLLFLFLFLISPAFAYDYQSNNNSVPNQQTTNTQNNSKEASEQVFDETKDQLIYDYFGSEESPAFLNRENIDPQEPNTGFTDD